MGGEFVEIDRPPRQVLLTMAFEEQSGGRGIVNRNTITFEEQGGLTTMTLHTPVEKAEGEIVLGALGGMEIGWGQSLDRLVALAEG
ncbi:MAG: SRPBCC domain-containing protein [Phenylobacterium sp.]